MVVMQLFIKAHHGARSSTTPIGSIGPVDGPAMLACDGALYPKDKYPEFYAILVGIPRKRTLLERLLRRPGPPPVCVFGETETHFNVPDLRAIVGRETL